jgi:hypothetical protein
MAVACGQYNSRAKEAGNGNRRSTKWSENPDTQSLSRGEAVAEAEGATGGALADRSGAEWVPATGFSVMPNPGADRFGHDYRALRISICNFFRLNVTVKNSKNPAWPRIAR